MMGANVQMNMTMKIKRRSNMDVMDTIQTILAICGALLEGRLLLLRNG